jgi:hypothetical protein
MLSLLQRSLFQTSTDPVTKPAELAKRSKANAKARSKDRSLRQLLQLDWVPLQEQVGCQAAFASRLAPTRAKAKAKAKQRSCPRQSRPTQQ